MIQVRLLRFASASLLALGIAFSASPARAQVAEAEPNSTCLTAQNLGALSQPLTVHGDIAAPDVDFYRITGKPFGLVTIRQRGFASNSGSLDDPFLGIFTGDCRPQGWADDDYESGNWLDARIEVNLQADGALVIAASSAYDWDFDGSGSGTGTYTLEIEEVATAEAIGGRLVDSKTGLPLRSVDVELRQCSEGICWTTAGYTLSGTDGRFRFEPNVNMYTPLRAGGYSLKIYAPSGYVSMETPAFQIAEGEDLDVGDVAVSPVPLVGSISGRMVDQNTRQPLAGTAVPFARVDLEACIVAWNYCYATASQNADAQGGFRFQSGNYGPLEGGSYRVRVFADQYFSTVTPIFNVADQQHYSTGDVALKSYPVRLTLVSGCGEIPSAGGSCPFTLKVTNGGTAPLKADIWSLVRAAGIYTPGEMTKFPAGPTRSVLLAPAASSTLSYSFDVQASLQDGTTVCARAYASDKKDPFTAIGIHDLFCLRKGTEGFVSLTEKEKREALKQEKAKD